MEAAQSSAHVSDITCAKLEETISDHEIYLCHPASKEEQQELADGFYYCKKLLIEANCITDTVSAKISKRSVLIGKELFNRFVDMYGSMFFTEEEVLEIAENTEEKKRKITELSSDSDEEEQKLEKIPFGMKIKAVQLAELHPEWSIKSLRSKSTRLLKDRSQLARWKIDIEKGGTRYDKLRAINNNVYDRFVEARDQRGLVTTQMLKQWAMTVAFQFLDGNFEFNASNHWVANFKKKYNISQRRVTKYVSKKERSTFEELSDIAAKYQQQTSNIITNFDPDYVINTDQTGCEYKISSNRTLTHKDEKMTEIAVQQLNKLTHSYTAQYALTLSGKLLPKVFICLQEVTGKFGPRVQKEVDEWMTKYTNVYVTSTKSGKLQSNTYEEVLDNIIQPYVKTEPFLYIIDSWGGQTSSILHQLKFTDEDGLPTCTLSIIPPKCTPFCQPCDVYFYRQVKNYIRRIQNAPYLLKHNKEITSREDMIKIHSLIHHQLQAPLYEKMLR